MRDYYPHKTLAELEPIYERLLEASNAGSLTSVGVDRGIANQFKGLSQDEIDVRLDRVGYSLSLRALDSGDADLITKWPDPTNRAGITRAAFNTR